VQHLKQDQERRMRSSAFTETNKSYLYIKYEFRI
jgi:hypothetical protein